MSLPNLIKFGSLIIEIERLHGYKVAAENGPRKSVESSITMGACRIFFQE